MQHLYQLASVANTHRQTTCNLQLRGICAHEPHDFAHSLYPIAVDDRHKKFNMAAML